jgi:hypothetical protein
MNGTYRSKLNDMIRLKREIAHIEHQSPFFSQQELAEVKSWANQGILLSIGA